MKQTLPHILNWFLNKKEHFIEFARSDTRLEGWFKGELVVLFNRLSERGLIERFQREVGGITPDRRTLVDFCLVVNGEVHLCELKVLCISRAATGRDLKFYFRDDNVGLVEAWS